VGRGIELRPGPSPKPTNLKRLAGNPGKRPLNESEPQFTADSGYCPRWLPETARAEWRRVVPELAAVGLLTVVDRAALEAYCVAYARWQAAELVLTECGLTFETESHYVMQRPEVAIANNAAKQMRAFMVEFGMTPSSRARVTLPERKQEDPYAAYLNSPHIVQALEELDAPEDSADDD